MADDDWWRQPLGRLLDGRCVILAGGPAVQWTRTVAEVRDLGAAEVLVVGTAGMGAGPVPEADHVVVADVEIDDDEMARLHAALDVLRDPPLAIAEAVESFDPGRDAVVIGTFLGESPTLCGRPFLAHRRPEWVALEDKTVVDALLDEAGVTRAPSIVVPLAEATARRHAVDLGAGTVWARDATGGFHGGGAGTRWVVDDDDAATTTEAFTGRCRHVRLMPFLDGIATSVHGIVLPDGVAVLRPVELVTLRRGRDLVYSGCATFWDPPTSVRDEMREAARRVAGVLRRTVDFRGAFTLDGVATVEGFRPTELNPRNGAGLNVITRGLGDVPLQLVLDLVVAGQPIDITAPELERVILAEADARRSGATWQLEADPSTEIAERAASWHDGGWAWTPDGATGDGIVIAGGRLVRCTFEPGSTPVGLSVGERAVAFWRFLDDEGITDRGLLIAPADVLATR